VGRAIFYGASSWTGRERLGASDFSGAAKSFRSRYHYKSCRLEDGDEHSVGDIGVVSLCVDNLLPPVSYRTCAMDIKCATELGNATCTSASLAARLVFITLALLAGECAGQRKDVLSAYEAEDGEVRVFPVRVDQAWDAARAALRWNHAEAIEEHPAERYMLGVAGATGWSWGATMGVWLEPAGQNGTKIRVVVSRKLATNTTAQSEGGLLDDIAKAVGFEMRGLPLPAEEPE
jgi:hypothetical protein